MSRLGLRRGVGWVMAVAVSIAAVGGWAAGSSALTATPNDPLFPQQWALTQADAPASWAVSTGAGVTIGIVDTGIDLGHRELGPKLVPGGAATCLNTNGDANSCVTGPGAGQDDNGHGSFVAGEAAAVTDDGYETAGVAPDARLVVAKVMDSQGQGAISDINAGIAWVIQHGARVVNLSLGPDTGILGGGGPALQPGLEYAWTHNAVPVIASGNTNVLGLLGSSGYGNVHAIVVGATGRTGQEASYSSPLAGTKWAILGPGGDGPDCNPPTDSADCVLSTYWVSGQKDAVAYAQGTSMATPMVSGLVAQLLGMKLSPQQAVDTILATAVPKPGCGCAGEIDDAAAVRAALAHGGRINLVADAAPPAAAGPAPTRAVTTTHSAPGPAGGVGLVSTAPTDAVEHAPAVAPAPIVPPAPVVVGAGGRGQNAAPPPLKSRPASHTRAVVRALGVVMLLVVIAAAVWFGFLEPSGRYPAH